MKIERDELIGKLMNFARSGNGIVVGRPGVGKSYSLLGLTDRLETDNIPCILLPIDRLGDGSEESLRRELEYEGDFVPWLRENIQAEAARPGVLLFDAFDAARDEASRARFLTLISDCLLKLEGLWNVLVTVRTYDAHKSGDLLDLFPPSQEPSEARYSDSTIASRHFQIPLLNASEISQVFPQVPDLEEIYRDASLELRELMRVPFHLWLLEQLSRSTPVKGDLRGVYSEVQLLSLFWRRRIRQRPGSDDREHILRLAARRMVEARGLSTPKDGLYVPSSKGAWAALLSDEILVEVGSRAQRVAFSHNILFDYAVSVLLTDEDPALLKPFLLEDTSRPLFLHPSLTYLLTQAWYESREEFWTLFWALLPSEELHLRLFARQIPTTVIINEARDTNDIQPFLEAIDADGPSCREAVLYLLYAFQASQPRRSLIWADFLASLSTRLHSTFVWQVAVVLGNQVDAAPEHDELKLLAEATQNLFSWTWGERQTHPEMADALLGAWVVELLAKTFSASPAENAERLTQVVALVNQPNFPITPIYRLAVALDKVWPYDPKFAASVYVTVFTRQELSDEKVQFGTAVVPLVTTRRQDFDMCQYVLSESFPKFLRAHPEAVLNPVLAIVNQYVVQRRVVPSIVAGKNFSDLIDSSLETFRFRRTQCNFLPDLSCIWDESRHPDTTQDLMTEVFKFLGELAAHGDIPAVESILDVIAHGNVVAFVWRRLLETGAQHPETFAPLLSELCTTRPLLTSPDTIRQVGMFLEAAARSIRAETLQQIEESILAIPEASEEARRGQAEAQRDRLIARIPADLLQSEQAKALRAAMEVSGNVIRNEPYFSIRTEWGGAYTDDDFLRDQGVALESEANQVVRASFAPLDTFVTQWTNQKPTGEAIRGVAPLVRDTYNLLHSGLGEDAAVANMGRTKVAACVHTMCRGVDDLDEEEYSFCRRLMLEYASDPLPVPQEGAGEQTSFPSWTPSPRTEAAQGLPWLAAGRADSEIIAAVERLSHDPFVAVRFLIASELFRISLTAPDEFWRLTERVATEEKDRGVLTFLCHSLWNVVDAEPDKTAYILTLLVPKFSTDTEDGLSEPLVTLIVRLILLRQNDEASKLFTTFLSDSKRYAETLRRAAHDLAQAVRPQMFGGTREQVAVAERAITWLHRCISAAAAAISELGPMRSREWTDEEQTQFKNVYGIIDHILLLMYTNAEVTEQFRGRHGPPASSAQVRSYYEHIKPLLTQALDYASDPEKGVLLPATAHHVMELLNGVLRYDPQGVLRLAARVATCGQNTRYELDPMAQSEAVKIVEAVLADHREAVREGAPLEDLLTLLDIFARAGWPNAQRLVWRLDEVFR